MREVAGSNLIVLIVGFKPIALTSQARKQAYGKVVMGRVMTLGGLRGRMVITLVRDV